MEIVFLGCLASDIGKTTTIRSLATCLTRFGFKVLLVDLSGDTSNYHWEDSHPKMTIIDVLSATQAISDVIVHTELYDILPAPCVKDLYDRYTPLTQCVESRLILSAALREKARYNLEEHYDFILIDALRDSMATDSAIVAADSIILTTDLSKYSLDGVDSLLHRIIGLERRGLTSAKIDGLVFSQYDTNWKTRRDMLKRILDYSAEKGIDVYQTKIRESSSVNKANYEGCSILKYTNNANKDALAFALEFLERRGMKPRRKIEKGSN